MKKNLKFLFLSFNLKNSENFQVKTLASGIYTSLFTFTKIIPTNDVPTKTGLTINFGLYLKDPKDSISRERDKWHHQSTYLC